MAKKKSELWKIAALTGAAGITGGGLLFLGNKTPQNLTNPPAVSAPAENADTTTGEDNAEKKVRRIIEGQKGKIEAIQNSPEDEIEKIYELMRKSREGDASAQDKLFTKLFGDPAGRKTAEEAGMDPEEYIKFIGKFIPARHLRKALERVKNLSPGAATPEQENTYEALLQSISAAEATLFDDPEFMKMIGGESKSSLEAIILQALEMNREKFSSQAYIALIYLGVEESRALQLTTSHRDDE